MDNYFVCVVRRYRSEAHNIKPRSIACSNLNYGTKFADPLVAPLAIALNPT